MKSGQIRPITLGWNSLVFILNDEYAIKIPKTLDAAAGIKKEMAITDAIRDLVPVSIPQYVSKLENKDAMAFAYRFIRGRMMTTKPLEPGARNFDPTSIADTEHYRSIQKQLAGILSSIHGIDIPLVKEIISGFETGTWDESYRKLAEKWFESLEKSFRGKELRAARSLLEDTVESIAGCDFQQKFIHGDFGGWNIIYDEDKKEIAGLLDWANCCIGDPALDFTELIYDYGERYTLEVLEFYGKNAHPGLLDRAKLHLRLEGFRDLQYGLSNDSSEFRNKGIKNIEDLIGTLGY